MTPPNKFNLDDMPEIMQRALYDDLAERFNGERRRAKQSVTKEQKVEAAAKILGLMKGYTLPQQRSLLKYTLRMVEIANKQFWRDPHGQGK